MNPSQSTVFYCHECNKRVTLSNDAFLCPECNGGFIEPAEDEASESEELLQPSDASLPSSSQRHSRIFPHLALSLPSSSLNSLHSRNLQRPGAFQFSSGRAVAAYNPIHQMTVQFFHPPGASGGAQSMEAELFHQIIQNVVGSRPGGIHFHGMAPNSMNPGDYVHGSEAFDAIITQLLNQMDGTGPPPAPRDQIASIPRVTITQADVDKGVQCAVCFDHFSVGDEVLKLQCEHCYHEDCIKPWLQLHNTCPVCRKNLAGQAQDNTQPEPFEIDIDLQNPLQPRSRARRSSHGSPPS